MLNFYENLVQLFIIQPGIPPAVLINQEGVTRGDHLSTFLYGFTITPLVEELWYAHPGLP